MLQYPEPLNQVIEVLRELPGVGRKTAERYAFHLLDANPEKLRQMASLIGTLQTEVLRCSLCGCLTGQEKCRLCDPSLRDTSSLCIIANAKDALIIEQTHTFKGMYHVLGGLLSPLEGIGPETLRLDLLKNRLETSLPQELIIALDSTVEGDATALYIAREFQYLSLKISRLALGLPMGSSLDFIDSGTLAHAIAARFQLS
ncbi:MAG: recombination mediator RecR [Chlamydiales bacterium]